MTASSMETCGWYLKKRASKVCYVITNLVKPKSGAPGYKLSLAEAYDPIETSARAAVNIKKNHVTSMKAKIEPVVYSSDFGQWVLSQCQLTIKWLSKIKDVRCKSRLHFSVDFLEYGCHVQTQSNTKSVF